MGNRRRELWLRGSAPAPVHNSDCNSDSDGDDNGDRNVSLPNVQVTCPICLELVASGGANQRSTRLSHCGDRWNAACCSSMHRLDNLSIWLRKSKACPTCRATALFQGFRAAEHSRRRGGGRLLLFCQCVLDAWPRTLFCEMAPGSRWRGMRPAVATRALACAVVLVLVNR